MKRKLNLFEKVLYEAPDDPPDLDMSDSDPGPPDLAMTEEPPDIGDDSNSDINSSEDPPDLDSPSPDLDVSDYNEETPSEGEHDAPEELDEKISTVVNMNLYQRFLSLLNKINSELFMIKNNSDILYTLSKDSTNTIQLLKKLDENIRLYLSNYFMQENYSKNLLFFNKCINLLKLINDIFNKKVMKGVSEFE